MLKKDWAFVFERLGLTFVVDIFVFVLLYIPKILFILLKLILLILLWLFWLFFKFLSLKDFKEPLLLIWFVIYFLSLKFVRDIYFNCKYSLSSSQVFYFFYDEPLTFIAFGFNDCCKNYILLFEFEKSWKIDIWLVVEINFLLRETLFPLWTFIYLALDGLTWSYHLILGFLVCLSTLSVWWWNFLNLFLIVLTISDY